jgi:gliding motility-associated lipoprotein GldH
MNSRYNAIMNKQQRYIFLPLFLLILSCTRTGVFEKNIPIPRHEWESGFQPKIDFDVTDTNAIYNIYIVLRHNNEYSYNNLWVKSKVKEPGSQEWKSQQYELPLATNNKGWLGTGMDDIFEHRILIQPQTKFAKTGTYVIQQIMRDDPLLNVYNVGLRIEKVQ